MKKAVTHRHQTRNATPRHIGRRIFQPLEKHQPSASLGISKPRFIQRLRAAAVGWGDVATARAAMRAASLQAAAAVKVQRATTADAGRVVAGFWTVQPNQRDLRRGVIAANGGRSAWAVATGQRAAASARAVHWRGVAARRAAANRAAFEGVLRGLRGDKFGDLARVFGAARRSAKLHSLFIRNRPAGKLARRADVSTVALKVGRTARAMPCAVLA